MAAGGPEATAFGPRMSAQSSGRLTDGSSASGAAHLTRKVTAGGLTETPPTFTLIGGSHSHGLSGNTHRHMATGDWPSVRGIGPVATHHSRGAPNPLPEVRLTHFRPLGGAWGQPASCLLKVGPRQPIHSHGLPSLARGSLPFSMH